MRLKGVYFDWKIDHEKVKKLGLKGSDFGFIAQEVFKSVPQVVYENEDGYLGMDYSKLVSIALGSLQEHQKTIEKLQTKINNIKVSITNG
jgi:hypothetical protein